MILQTCWRITTRLARRLVARMGECVHLLCQLPHRANLFTILRVPDAVDEDDLEAELAGLEDELGAEDFAEAQPSYLQPCAYRCLLVHCSGFVTVARLLNMRSEPACTAEHRSTTKCTHSTACGEGDGRVRPTLANAYRLVNFVIDLMIISRILPAAVFALATV
jgi:hypothetical protein